MAARKVVKKAIAKKTAPVRAPETALDKEAAQTAIDSKDASKGGKPKIHAKVVHILVSVGTEDRNRSHEKFVEDVRKKLGLVDYGKKGLHGSVTGGYYILDGKVCLPEDYNPKTGTFKPGAVPPVWAGGPKPSRLLTSQQQMEADKINLSSDAYDRKYSIGKYAPKAQKTSSETHKQHTERMRAERAARKAEQLRAEEEEIEDILDDDEALEEVASASRKRAIKKLKSTPKKRVVTKKAAPTKKKVVRRG